jgi:tRNA-modifying protein YgfZ
MAMMKPTFGDVIEEYRAVTGEAGLVSDAHEVVWVEGRDAARFLQGIISQDVEGMTPGEVGRAFLLGPQGKLKALLRVARGEERVGLVVDAGHGLRLVDDLDYYRIRVKATVRLDDRPVWEVWGPSAGAVTGVVSGWEDRDATTLITIPMRGLERVAVVGDKPEGVEVRAGRLATSAARVVHGEPVFGIDVDESTIPQETGLVPDSVSFVKGCYLGQELVARIDSRGHVNRVLRSLAITRNVLPPEAAPVYSGEKQVGAITSVSETLTSPVGLVLLRREVEVGDTVLVRWDGGEAPAIVKAAPLEPDGSRDVP